MSDPLSFDDKIAAHLKEAWTADRRADWARGNGTYRGGCEPGALWPSTDRALTEARRANLKRERRTMDEHESAGPLGLALVLLVVSGFWLGVGLAIGWALWGRGA